MYFTNEMIVCSINFIIFSNNNSNIVCLQMDTIVR